MFDAIKEVIGSFPRFTREFVNLVGSPRSYAASGKVFSVERYGEALAFLGFSLLITLVLKNTMFASARDHMPYLFADAVWKFTVVLIETAIITFSWYLLKGRYRIGEYLTANCFYFGALSILGHLILLIVYAINRRIHDTAAASYIYWFTIICLGGSLILWTLTCWRSYGDFNHATPGRTALALLVVCVLSVPALRSCFKTGRG